MNSIVEKIKAAVLEMKDDALVIYAERGFEPFKKPLLIAAPVLLVLYGAVYVPSSDKYQSKKLEVEHLEAISVHYREYNDMLARKTELRRRLPLAKDKGEWLSYILASTSRDHGITFDSLLAQEEQKAGPLVLVSRGASVTSTYDKIGKWLAEIENSKIYLKITQLQISRRAAAPGMLKVTIKLSTMFPAEDRASEGGGS